MKLVLRYFSGIFDFVDEGLMSEIGLYLTVVLFIETVCIVYSPRARRLCSLFTSKHVVSRYDIHVYGIIVVEKQRLTILSMFYVYAGVYKAIP